MPLLTGRELPGVFDDAVARLEHALDLAALGALGQPAIRKGYVDMFLTSETTSCLGRPLERLRVLASGHVCGRMRGKHIFSKRFLRHKV